MFDSHKVAGVISCNPLIFSVRGRRSLPVFVPSLRLGTRKTRKIFSCSGRRSLPVFVPSLRLGTRKKSAQADFVCIAAISIARSLVNLERKRITVPNTQKEPGTIPSAAGDIGKSWSNYQGDISERDNRNPQGQILTGPVGDRRY
jgi:hypothetical protein